LILDAGFLISVDREEQSAKAFLAAATTRRTSLRTTHPVVAQVWRHGARQARLARFLNGVEIYSFDDGHSIGNLLARSGTADVVDAHLVVLAVALGDAILTGDVEDLTVLVATLQSGRPRIQQWP
jgi:predicted nucleic acid-binding protein